MKALQGVFIINLYHITLSEKKFPNDALGTYSSIYLLVNLKLSSKYCVELIKKRKE